MKGVKRMLKRILGCLVLLAGLGLTAWVTVTMAFAIPANFHVEAKGLEYLAELIIKYRLRSYFLLIAVGLTLCLTSVALFLAPRRRKTAVSAEKTVDVREELAVAEDSVADEKAALPCAFLSESPDLIRIFRSRIMATAFCNPGGRNRQLIIREAKAGDVVSCRSMGNPLSDEGETVGIFSVKGEQMGVMDTALFYAIRDKYPNHRIGVTVDRVSGGCGIPYDCYIRVSIYRG
jgi:hypothetical protein